MIRAFRARRASGDAGFTLVELLVASIILVVVMTIAGAIFIQLLTAQRDVRDMASANNENQLVFKSLERDIRNSAASKILGSGTVLLLQTRAATSTNSNNWLCVGYYFDATGKSIRRTQSTGITKTKPVSSLTTDAAIRTATAAWPIKIAGFSKIGTSRPFGTVDGIYSSPDQIQIRLSALTGNGHDPVSFRKTVGMRPQGTSASAGCF